MKMENNYYYKTKLRVNEHYREIYNVYVIYVNVKALTRKNRKIYKSPVDCFFFSSFECKTGKKNSSELLFERARGREKRLFIYKGSCDTKRRYRSARICFIRFNNSVAVQLGLALPVPFTCQTPRDYYHASVLLVRFHCQLAGGSNEFYLFYFTVHRLLPMLYRPLPALDPSMVVCGVYLSIFLFLFFFLYQQSTFPLENSW